MTADAERAIRAACDEMAGDSRCRPCQWPGCAAMCGNIAKTVRATLATLPDPQPSEAQLQRVDAVLAPYEGRTLTADDVWRMKKRVRTALGVKTEETKG